MCAKLLNFHLNQDEYLRNYHFVSSFITKLGNLYWFRIYKYQFAKMKKNMYICI